MRRRKGGKKKKKENLEITDGGERFLADCFPIQAVSNSEVALHWVLLQPILLPVPISCHTI